MTIIRSANLVLMDAQLLIAATRGAVDKAATAEASLGEANSISAAAAGLDSCFFVVAFAHIETRVFAEGDLRVLWAVVMLTLLPDVTSSSLESSWPRDTRVVYYCSPER